MKERALVRSMPRVLAKYFDSPQIHATTDYIYAVGDLPVALVAHLDTVHKDPPQNIYHDQSKGVIWCPEGLGADDRAGVYSIINILEAGYRPSVIFTTGEEIGGLGAKALVDDFKKPLSSLLFMIELDRQGKNDAVYYDCGNEEFEEFISRYGFITDWGTFSDIAVIGPVWDVAAVNLSIGYFDEHTLVERLNYRYMFKTIKSVMKILDDPGDKEFDYKEVIYQKWANGFVNTTGTASNSLFYCDCCAFPTESKDLRFVNDWLLCPSCRTKHMDVCVKCGNEFINPYGQAKNHMCEACADD